MGSINMKKIAITILLIILICFSLTSQNIEAILSENNLIGIWTPASKFHYMREYTEYSWGTDLSNYYMSVIIDKINANEYTFRFFGNQAYIENIKIVNERTFILYLSDRKENDFETENKSIVVINRKTPNSIFIEGIEAFSTRTNYDNYTNYLRSSYDLAFSIDHYNQVNNDNTLYRHEIDLYSENITASANNSYVRLRSEPNLNGEGKGFLQQGETVQVIEISDHMEEIGDNIDNWYKVKTSDGTEAWTFGAFLDFPESAYVWYDGENEGE